MAGGGDSLSLTDPDVDVLAWEFLRSRYAGEMSPAWPLDQRLSGFLRWSGFPRIADDGDLFNIVLDRVMSYISIAPRRSPSNQQVTGRR